MVCRFDRNQ